MKKSILCFSILLLSFVGCSKTRVSSNSNLSTMVHATNRIVIYKTQAKYQSLVPIQMNANKDKILSFPDPLDVKIAGQYLTPIALENGFFLDRKGINQNVVFLDYTYPEYAELKSIDPNDLIQHIHVKYPIMAMYECGNWMDFSQKTPQLIELLNHLIQKEAYHTSKVYESKIQFKAIIPLIELL